MRAIYFTRAGEPADVLAVGDFDKPLPHSGEALVRVLASPIQPADFLFIHGRYRLKPQFPQIAGLEGAGIVESTDPSVAIAPGTLVSFLWRGTWSEYLLVPAKELTSLPNDFPLEKAAQFTLNPFTAWGLLERIDLKAGEWLLVTAGNSAVSQLLIQLALIRGIKVIAVIRHNRYRHLLESLGAETIDTSAEDLESRVHHLTGGKGVNGALDPIGGPIGTVLVKTLAPGGKLIAYGSLSADSLHVSYPDLVYRFVSLSGFGIRSWLESKSAAQKFDIAQQLAGLLAKEDFRLDVAATFSFTEFNKAVQQAGQGTDGKVLLRFDWTK